MYVFATPMCVWRRHAARHRRCKGVKVVGRRASPRRRKNYECMKEETTKIRKVTNALLNTSHEGRGGGSEERR